MIFLRVLYIFIFLLISSQSFSSSKCKYNFLPKSNEQPFALFTRSIDILNVPFRARNALKAKDIYYLGDLVTKTEIELMRIPHLKKTDINSIKGFFLNMDLHLGLDINWPSDREQVEALVEKLNSKVKLTPVFTRPIDDLNLSLSAQNALKAKGIYYLGDLVTKTEIDLMRIPHLKKTDINSINGFFLNMDLRLGLNINWPSDREQVEALVRRIKFKSEINSRIHSGSPTKKQLSNEHNF